MISYWTIRARLLRVPGVANVAIWGERIQMPQVQVDPERLRANDVSLDEVMEVTADSLDAGILTLFRRSARSEPGGSSTPPINGSASSMSCRSSRPDDLAQVTVDEEAREGRCAWATWPMSWRNTSR